MAMAATHLERGAAGEALAAEYLVTQGVKVLARNLRCRLGEIDLVCLDHEVIVIVEVRSRASSAFGGALASVSRSKQRKLIRATEFHRQREAQWRQRRLRFDVIALQGTPRGDSQLLWIRDAFRAT